MGRLSHKVALVTDGNSGIGLATAKRFVTEDAFVFWSVDLKGRGIRVNAVSPGHIPTPAHTRLGITSDVHVAVSTEIPLGRVGTADEVANAVVFLASDESSYITGIELFVDGGVAQV